MATTHFVLFQYLNNRRVGIDTAIPQSWVTSISLVLANSFRLSVCFCIGVAFTQHLWRTVRVKSMSVGNLDQLHYLRNDITALFSTSLIRLSPTLVAMGCLGWLISIAAIFPPGAITVTSKLFDQVSDRSVPSFNSTYQGNGTVADAFENLLSSTKDTVYTYVEQIHTTPRSSQLHKTDTEQGPE